MLAFVRGGVANGHRSVLCNFYHVKTTDTKKRDDNANVADDLHEDQTPEPWFEDALGLSEQVDGVEGDRDASKEWRENAEHLTHICPFEDTESFGNRQVD